MNLPLNAICSRRRFLKLAGSSFLLANLPSLLRASWGELETISIFHTTDLHGNILPTSTYDGVYDVGGLARCATRIAQWRQRQPHHLLVDLGDLYQGTQLSYRTDGEIMIKCLNHLNYDAWILGNHEFDWGIEKVENAVEKSAMPVLTANSSFDGKEVWEETHFGETPVLPYILKEVGGYKIAFIGLTTPGMPNWFLPELLGGFSAADPVPVLRKMIDKVKAEGAEAIVVGTHMGIRPWTTEDDAANRLFALTEACPEIDIILGGHTHRDLPHSRINGVPYTQANYFGIHLGRVDLTFDRESRKLIDIQPMTSYMDSSVSPDASVVALASEDIEKADQYLSRTVGVFADTLEIEQSPGVPSDVERLIGASLLAGMEKRGHRVDAAIHGLLFMDDPVSAGTKTVDDMWDIIPFENFVVTAEVTREELEIVLLEMYGGRQIRSIIGLYPEVTGRGQSLAIKAIRDEAGEELQPGSKVRIAINSYDAASGGGRFPETREILSRDAAKRTLHRYQSRALLAEFVEANSPVSLASLPGAVAERAE